MTNKTEQLAEILKSSGKERIVVKIERGDGGWIAALGFSLICFRILSTWDRILAIFEAAVQ